MAVTLPIESVAASADIMFLLLFIQVNWALIRMRTTHPDLDRTYTVPFMPWPPIIGIIAQVVLLPFLVYELGLEAIGIGTGNEGLVALGVTAVWMIIGLGIFYGYSKGKQEERREEETPTIAAERTPESRESEIVVPIANPESVEPLMRTATDIARDRDAEIHVISVVTVPQQTPIDNAEQFVSDERDTLNQAISFGEEAGVPVNGTIRVGHDVAQAILNTVEQYGSEMVLMGWHGRQQRRRDIVLGSIVDEVVTKARCDVLVERIGATQDVNDILVPAAGGPHSEFAAEIAQAIARTTGASITIIRVVDANSSDQDYADAEERLESTATALDSELEIDHKILTGDNVADTIVRESADHELTIIGATREGLLDRIVFGDIPEEVGKRANNTVIMAKRNLGITSRLSRLFGEQ